MKTTMIALIAVLVLGFGSIALAAGPQGPVVMTDIQMDSVVAGTPPAWGLDKNNTRLIWEPVTHLAGNPNDLEIGRPAAYEDGQNRTNYHNNSGHFNAYFDIL